MSQMSDYLENALLAHTLGKTAMTMPGGAHLALFTTAPSDGTPGTEVSTSGTGYARQAITSAMSAPSGGVSSNSSVIIFGPSATSWGTVTHFGIFDAATAGNMLLYGTLAAAKTVAAADKIEWAAGQLVVTFS